MKACGSIQARSAPTTASSILGSGATAQHGDGPETIAPTNPNMLDKPLDDFPPPFLLAPNGSRHPPAAAPHTRSPTTTPRHRALSTNAVAPPAMAASSVLQRPSFSLTEARAIVRDLFVPNQRIYWLDFLATILVGHVCFALTRTIVESQSAAALAEADPLGCHLRRAMRDLLSGRHVRARDRSSAGKEIPRFPRRLEPALRHSVPRALLHVLHAPRPSPPPDVRHQARRRIPAVRDHVARGGFVAFLAHALWVPPLAVIRFGLLTPLTWFIPPLRRFLHQRASSLVIDPSVHSAAAHGRRPALHPTARAGLFSVHGGLHRLSHSGPRPLAGSASRSMPI